jgi:Restriction endonuclease
MQARDRAISTTTQRFHVGAVRYIKLGEGGKWASKALSAGTIPFGHRAVDHQACARRDWTEVGRQLTLMGRQKGGIAQGLRELKDFYELGDDTLWFTVAHGQVWWAFAHGPVIEGPEKDPGSPSRYRRTRGGWRNTSLEGDPLSVLNLSSALTSTANYRMTICAVKHADYLIRKIVGEIDPLRIEAEATTQQACSMATKMIRRLDWKDFETLIDLIFTRGGWQRVGALGGDQADVDLVLKQPISGETAWVQVKSRSSQAEFDDYLGRFKRSGRFDRFFFIYHSATTPIRIRGRRQHHLWSVDRIASAAIDLGFLSWLSERTT